MSLNGSVSSSLPLNAQLRRNSVAMDYLPTLRSIARSDQLGIAVNRLRRGRRFHDYLSQIGVYVNNDDQIRLSNFLIDNT